MTDAGHSLQPGLSARVLWHVTNAQLYSPTGRPEHAVLSSPSMILKLEETAVHAVQVHLPPGKVTVGFHVDVKHVAPAKSGALMTTTARLVAVDGPKLTFEVEARDDDRLVGIGIHRRAVIDLS